MPQSKGSTRLKVRMTVQVPQVHLVDERGRRADDTVVLPRQVRRTTWRLPRYLKAVFAGTAGNLTNCPGCPKGARKGEGTQGPPACLKSRKRPSSRTTGDNPRTGV